MIVEIEWMKIIYFLSIGASLFSCKTFFRNTGLEMCKSNCDLKSPNSMTYEKREQLGKNDGYDKGSVIECIKKCEKKYK